jgi:hypothetical protein
LQRPSWHPPLTMMTNRINRPLPMNQINRPSPMNRIHRPSPMNWIHRPLPTNWIHSPMPKKQKLSSDGFCSIDEKQFCSNLLPNCLRSPPAMYPSKQWSRISVIIGLARFWLYALVTLAVRVVSMTIHRTEGPHYWRRGAVRALHSFLAFLDMYSKKYLVVYACE